MRGPSPVRAGDAPCITRDSYRVGAPPDIRNIGLRCTVHRGSFRADDEPGQGRGHMTDHTKFPPTEESIDRLRRSGWSTGEAAWHVASGGIVYHVDGSNGENKLR